MTTEEKQELLMRLAEEALGPCEAGSVLVIALTRNDAGRLQMLVSTAGAPAPLEFIADRLPDVTASMKKSAPRSAGVVRFRRRTISLCGFDHGRRQKTRNGLTCDTCHADSGPFHAASAEVV